MEVILFEKNGTILREASSAGFGSLTPHSDPNYRGEAEEFAKSSVDLYRTKFLKDIEKISGIKIPFIDDGLIEIFPTESSYLEFTKEFDKKDARIKENFKFLSAEETVKLEPSLTGSYFNSVWINEPWLDKEIFFKCVKKTLFANEKIKKHFGIKKIKVERRLEEILISVDGKRNFQVNRLIICTGLQFGKIDGLRSFPQRFIRGDAVGVHTVNNKPLLKRHIYMGDGFVTPRSNGFMLLGATYEEDASFLIKQRKDRINIEQLKKIIRANEAILPRLKECEIGRVWRGWRPTPEDKNPILGLMYPNIVIATGFMGLGITVAPAVATTVEDFCVFNKNRFPKSFSPERFRTYEEE
jgi:glycine/D-amino acid oxidase-like deaminating enzyme